jgi:iron(III) transport system permease protein
MIFIGVLALLICLPILGIAAAWLQLDAAVLEAMRQQAQTVLPAYLITSGWLALLVTLGVIVVGAATATVIGLFEFRGRRFWAWALLLPMAMPAYVSAYAYTDMLQYGGFLQSSLRSVFPHFRVDVRSLGGAVFLFIFTLYPYAYLLARNALQERGAHLLEAAAVAAADLAHRLAAGATGPDGRCRTGPDGDAGRLWRERLFRLEHFYHRDLQGLDGDG